uniref:Cytochrome P450 CYP3027C2 n=1 Tax=Tigriopus japonicus TaxID=158387 RepID=A0A088DIB0_TIGJA|nr:cytochrome P450 CYP3027C2 [Tigriopus japonicus]
MHEVQMDKMKKFGKTYVGYEYVQPILITIDPDLIKSVTITHFENFTDILNFKIEPKVTTLDTAGGTVWHVLRKNMSPTFSSGKLKGMMEPISEIANEMIEYLNQETPKNPDIDVKQLFQSFALETISQSAFGIKSDAFQNKESELLKHGREGFSSFVMHNFAESLLNLALNQFPGLLSYISLFPAAYYKLYDITANIMKQRLDQGIKKKDFLARLQELIEEIKENPNGEVGKNLTDEHITAQGAIFFLAGFETTANALATLCYNLAQHPEIQDKVREEINNVVDEFDGRIDYESVQSMKYLEACIQENLRMYPPATLHIRQCTKDTEIAPGLVIKKGMRVDFPIYTSHHNPEFFPEPETFNPDRFLPENEKTIKPLTFRPFGGGPRFCIGQRFALIEMKLAVAKLLTSYQINTSPKTKLEFDKGSPFLLSYPELVLRMNII